MRCKSLSFKVAVFALRQFDVKSTNFMLFSASFSTSNSFQTLLSADECLKLHNSNDVKFLDASWYVGKTRDARVEFLSERIPGARFFDIERISDLTNPLPHMLPTPNFFESEVSDLGISSTDHVIIYTKNDCFSAPRAWWTFKVFGHKRVSILNGGINAWKKIGGNLEVGALSDVPKGNYSAKLNSKCVSDWKEVLSVVQTGQAQLLDARSSARFKGEVAEPRPNLERGHIPGSLNLPFTEIVEANDMTSFRSPEAIRKAFEDAGVVFGAKTILTCGTGVTACVLAVGLNILGENLESTPVYDGSWTEWGSPLRIDLPKVK